MIRQALMLLACMLLGSAALAADAAQCDRECLRGVVTQYLDALVKRNPAAVPVAPTVRFTEDRKEMKLGEGLWKTASKLGSYRQDILDVRMGVAGTHAIVYERDRPVMFAARLKVVDRKITEVETLTVRNAEEGLIFDVDTLNAASADMNVLPKSGLPASREEAIRVAAFYPAGLKAGGFDKVDAPFAAHAYRLENGRLMAGPGCTFRAGCGNIKTQPSPERPTLTSRLLSVDEELGIVWYQLTWARPNREKGDEKLVVWELFKVYDGKMQAVEAFMELAPANQGSGWE